MGLILKHTLKNIICKPGRTILLLVCIFMCSLAAALSLDMSQSVERLFANMMGDYFGSADILFKGTEELDDDFYALVDGESSIAIYSNEQVMRRRDPEMYTYNIVDNINVIAFDLEKAYEMDLLLTEVDISENEAVMPEELAKLHELSEGDVFTLYDEEGEKVEYTLKQIIKKGGYIGTSDVLVSLDGAKRLIYGDELSIDTAFINVADDKNISKVEDDLKEAYPEAKVENIFDNEAIAEAVKQVKNLFIMFFAVCLLVVIIITLTVSGRIMCERMPVVGTLRSLGVSRFKTTAILLLENVIYAVAGSVPAILFYLVIRSIILDAMFTVTGEVTVNFGNMSVVTAVGIIIGAIVIECLCTLKESLRVSGIAIRDVIFQGNDSEFRFSMSKTIIGIICLAVGIVCCFFEKYFAALILGFLGIIVAVYLLFPYVIFGVSVILEKLFDALGMPVAKIACTEIRVRKSTIASTSLIIAAASVAVLVITFADSMYDVVRERPFDCSVIVSMPSEEDYMYDYFDRLDGVTETQNIYLTSVYSSEINDKQVKLLNIYGFDDGSLFTGIKGRPENVKNNEVYMGEDLAHNLGISIGDEITVNYNTDAYIPMMHKLTLKGFINSVSLDGNGTSILISKDNFVSMFEDIPLYILVKTEDGKDEEVCDLIKKYSSTTASMIQTGAEYFKTVEIANYSETQIIKLLGYMGILLTLIGVVSNQLIGFESRKRENAVLLSTSMKKKHLKRMLFIETFISSAISLVCSVPLSAVLLIPLKKVIRVHLQIAIPLVFNYGEIIAVIAVLIAAFSLTVIFPYFALRKMKLSEQLKYE